MPRIYTEIRISHKTEYEKSVFQEQIKEQADKFKLTIADYIRLIIELDSATNLIERLKGYK